MPDLLLGKPLLPSPGLPDLSLHAQDQGQECVVGESAGVCALLFAVPPSYRGLELPSEPGMSPRACKRKGKPGSHIGGGLGQSCRGGEVMPTGWRS